MVGTGAGGGGAGATTGGTFDVAGTAAVTLKMLWIHAEMLCEDDGTTLDDLRELVTTLEDSARGARQVYGSAHPFSKGFEYYLRKLRAALAARETPSPGSA